MSLNDVNQQDRKELWTRFEGNSFGPIQPWLFSTRCTEKIAMNVNISISRIVSIFDFILSPVKPGKVAKLTQAVGVTLNLGQKINKTIPVKVIVL